MYPSKAFLVLLLAGATLVSSTVIDPKLKKIFQEKDETTVIISFHKSNVAQVRERFRSLRLTTRNARLNSMYKLLKEESDIIQAPVSNFLAQTRGQTHRDVRQLWINGKMIVRGIDQKTIQELVQKFPDIISLIEADRILTLEPTEVSLDDPSLDVIQWGVQDCEAVNLWDLGHRGEGVIVANIDTGVRHTHETLRDNFRSHYGWYSPYYLTPEPADVQGHGTHTMGTLCGNKGIGVAPGATWIACRGCDTNVCYGSDLQECGQWVACPTDTNGENPDCTQAPHIVSNSWGGGQGQDWYDDIIRTWRQLDIMPFFSIGNAGPTCGSAMSPGDRPEAIAVGATTINRTCAYFSSRGPTVDLSKRVKPDISAPGYHVVSAYPTNDTSYAMMSGTSMACPHAAGLAALLKGKSIGTMSLDIIEEALEASATPTLPQEVCVSPRAGIGANNEFGHGIINGTASNNYLDAGMFKSRLLLSADDLSRH